ncbi:MAG: Xaa-Pro aminopeptidase [Mucinivorans sp.]
MFSPATYSARRDELRRAMCANGQKGIVLLLGNAEAPRNYKDNAYAMRQDSTFLYYFGLTRHDLAAVIDLDAATDHLFGDDYTVDDIIWMGPQPLVAQQGATAGCSLSGAMADLARTVSAAVKAGRIVHILPPYRADNLLLAANLLAVNTDEVRSFVSQKLIEAVVGQREIKSDEELAQIQDACHIGYLMHTRAMSMAREGASERQIAGAIEGISLELGAGVSFHSIVSVRGETLHNHSHNGVLKTGELLLVDAGAENVMNYCSDYTRVSPVGGKFSQRQKEIYEIVLHANQKAKQLARAGVTYQSVHLDVAYLMAEEFKALGLLRGDIHDAVLAGAPALFMPHGLGHQMGLDVHDMEDLGERFVGYNRLVARSTVPGVASLRMGKELREGHVITVEPGVYFVPALIEKWAAEGTCRDFINFDLARSYYGFGGIRLEDDIVITADGNRQMGDDHVPITVAEVEEFMRQG